jgi:hypothetical protein
MTLGKDEIQKIVLSGLLLIGLIYGYFNMLLGPLSAKQEAAAKSTEELRKKVAEHKAKIRLGQQMDNEAPAAVNIIRQVNAMIPEGSPVAWFPTQMAEHFKQHGIEKISTRMNSEQAEKELAGFRRITWGIDLPQVNFVKFAQALASLENQHPLVEVSGLQVETGTENPENQRVLLTVRNLVKQ